MLRKFPLSLSEHLAQAFLAVENMRIFKISCTLKSIVFKLNIAAMLRSVRKMEATSNAVQLVSGWISGT